MNTNKNQSHQQTNQQPQNTTMYIDDLCYIQCYRGLYKGTKQLFKLLLRNKRRCLVAISVIALLVAYIYSQYYFIYSINQCPKKYINDIYENIFGIYAGPIAVLIASLIVRLAVIYNDSPDKCSSIYYQYPNDPNCRYFLFTYHPFFKKLILTKLCKSERWLEEEYIVGSDKIPKNIEFTYWTDRYLIICFISLIVWTTSSFIYSHLKCEQMEPYLWLFIVTNCFAYYIVVILFYIIVGVFYIIFTIFILIPRGIYIGSKKCYKCHREALQNGWRNYNSSENAATPV